MMTHAAHIEIIHEIPDYVYAKPKSSKRKIQEIMRRYEYDDDMIHDINDDFCQGFGTAKNIIVELLKNNYYEQTKHAAINGQITNLNPNELSSIMVSLLHSWNILNTYSHTFTFSTSQSNSENFNDNITQTMDTLSTIIHYLCEQIDNSGPIQKTAHLFLETYENNMIEQFNPIETAPHQKGDTMKRHRQIGDTKFTETIRVGDIVQHFKRELCSNEERKANKHLYRILAFATHTETEELLVIYQGLYGDMKCWARPANLFFAEVDHNKYPYIKQKYRLEVCYYSTTEQTWLPKYNEKDDTHAEN